VAIPIKLVPVIVGIMMAIITTPAVSIVRAVIGTIIRSRVIPVRIIITVRIISVKARTEPDTEVNLSIRTRGPREHQTPGHDCDQQKFLHLFTSQGFNKEIGAKFPPYSHPTKSG
jgi:hypothetical protein